ncbi:class I SAM-dependent methyltransferase [Bradyrhizobium arachidis]|uniref:Methyltransferase domain-containing protein n=2 Tax=Bradyrhizobium arachidis TaxID=858423 RepID=A0AAE7TLL0_9BRAD|nr:methyltransferase domain-containing protein [Bradyrhizobium arachidis]SFV14931.1 Methyltransferase domain-containing protein [Bradyrhizobium arachidis]
MPSPIQFWNEKGEEFARIARDPGSFFARRAALVAELVSNHISPGRVLDIGCGAGQLCFDLARRGFDVYGVDLSSVQIEMAIQTARGRLSLPDKRFQVCTPQCLSFNGPFDVITAIGVLPYVEDHSAFIKRALSLLEPNGMFVASCTNSLSLFTGLAVARHMRAFQPDRAWFSVLANLVRTGLWSGTCVDFRIARQCGSAAALDRLCERLGLVIVGELDLYNVTWSSFDRSPFERGRIGRMLSRRLGWTHVGAYRKQFTGT